MNYKKVLVILFFCIGIYVFFTIGVHTVPSEEISVPSAVGYDINKKGSEIEYSIPLSAYNYTGEEIPSTIIQTGVAKTLPETREDRQMGSDLKFMLGLEKVSIWGEDYARYGLDTAVDILFSNPTINDTGLNVVCKGKAIDFLKLSIKGYASSGDYLDGILHQATESNFFSDNYKTMDIFVRVGAEGRTLVLPYIEIIDKKPKITGVAVFDRDKMATTLGINEAKILNLLKEDTVKGMLSISKNTKEYITYEPTSKRKVSCEKIGDKYKFTIDLSLKGDILNNTLYKDIADKSAVQKEFINDMERTVTEMCYDFIDKMQNDYKIDCLALGKVAAAKYGRHTGTDWNKAVSEADIVVNVKVKLDKFGRGNY